MWNSFMTFGTYFMRMYRWTTTSVEVKNVPSPRKMNFYIVMVRATWWHVGYSHSSFQDEGINVWGIGNEVRTIDISIYLRVIGGRSMWEVKYGLVPRARRTILLFTLSVLCYWCHFSAIISTKWEFRRGKRFYSAKTSSTTIKWRLTC